MKIDVIAVEIPFRRPFAHARNAHDASRPQLIRVTLADGTTGWGEAQPREYVTGETPESVRATVEALARKWRGCEIGGLDDAVALVRAQWTAAVPAADVHASRVHTRGRDVHASAGGTPAVRSEGITAPAAFAGIELALLDAAGRREGRNVTEILGSVKTDTLLYDGAVLGFLPIAPFRMALAHLARAGKTTVKLKVGRDDDRERVSIARRILGDGVRLILDANAAWTAPEAIERIQALDDLGIDIVEQPVARDDFAGMAAVRNAVRPRIMADESLRTMDDARKLIGAADVWNVRIGKCGGLLASIAMLDLAREQGIECHLGVMVGETGIAGTAGRLLAACRTDLRHLEFDETGNATADVLREPLAPIRGLRAPVPPLRPGLGYDVDPAAVEALRDRSLAA